MEQNSNTSLFGLTIDPTTKANLSEAARWAKFIAIVGFVLCILMVLGGIFFSSIISMMGTRYPGAYSNSFSTGGFGIVMAVMYIIIAVIIFMPYLFLFRFASKMKTALAANDQNVLNSSFQNLKQMFQYVGVLTIIGLAFYAIAILMMLVTARSSF